MFLKTIRNFSFKYIQFIDLNLARRKRIRNSFDQLKLLPLLSIPEGSAKQRIIFNFI